ncbi:hypothetical protein KY290_006859 [Solanum tuberosum]|uniref:HECT-type E3 ubiquitin transferase n=1 Tax=Solanum tuberosum TaxID=4113 RepID=A0ABQ7W3T2_SOLTU|nr:hypothetical protein KY284_008958 [Solanum tuberosum]KAH0775448.1 hypothetical protein KY290_006859 [Solanum tuberosum]
MSPFSINNNNTGTNKRKCDVVIAKDQLNDLSSKILELCKNKDNSIEPYSVSDQIQSGVINFLSATPNDFDRATEHLELFISSSVPKALISVELSLGLDSTMGTYGYEGLSFTLVHDFTAFVLPVWNALQLMDNDTHEEKFYENIGLPLCKMFYDLLAKMACSLRQLAMMMLPEVEDAVEDPYNMLIDRSKLLVDSFEYIAKLDYLPGSFFVKFEEEQTTGPGVLREWFLLACQEIFNPNNALFIACPDDNRSFFPNQVDQDVLALTFVCEVESLGVRREIELCPNGKDIVVDSKNWETYVHLLIQHHYVTSIAEQVAYFSKGFSDVITRSRLWSFFRCLSLKDFNLMLGGRSDFSVEDWKAHTDYNAYEESDLQISWFWKIVETMSVEQRKMLLFFWTSIKSLPFEGFGGLDSRLSIHKTLEPDDYLPSSHTCFYQLCFPIYQSMTEMEDRLRIITQRDIRSSFGTV